jgi:3-oxoacyl-[acyl-carrier-protein] synthase II
MAVSMGAEVTGFTPPPELAQHPDGTLGRFAQFILTAGREALADAGLGAAGYPGHRIGSVLGVGLGALELMQFWHRTWSAEGSQAVARLALDSIWPVSATNLLASEAGALAGAQCVVSACASSAHALGEAFEAIRSGESDAVVAGGAESGLIPLGVSMFERIGALSKRCDPPSAASRPFDRDRDGFVMGEGAAILVLEELSHAKRRGAKIYGELAGYGATCDAFHVTRPPDDGDGMRRAMAAALRSARCAPEKVEYINAHGTGTPFNDVAETQAIKSVFGAHAHELWISSNKSMTGHLLGGSGALETVATLQTLVSHVVPPTINLDNPDPECDLDYVPHVARTRPIRLALNNAFGFGGQNACLVLKAV